MRGHRYVGWEPIEAWRARHFGSPNIPKPAPPPSTTQIEDKSVQDEANKQRGRLRRQRGRASTLLAGDTLGATSTLGTSTA